MEEHKSNLAIEKELEDEILFKALEDEINNSNDVTPNKPKKKKKKKKFLAKLKKGLRIRTVLLLLVTLIVNTYAWFIYVSTVSASLAMHIKNWDVVFSDGENEEDFVFTVERIYPGMDDAEQTISVTNNGETNAKMQLVIQSIKILDEEFYVTSEFAEANPTATVKTTEQLLDMALNNYPFKIHIIINGEEYDGSEISVSSEASVDVLFKVTWDYETGADDEEIAENDEIDTTWGSKAYTFMQTATSSDYCIEVKVKMQAVQDNS